MTVVYYLLLFLHFVGWAIVLGGTVTNLRTPRLAPGVLHGALTALLTGILMTGVAEMSDDLPSLNYMKIGIKLVIAAVITALVIVANRKKEPSRALIGSIAALTALNIAIAALWR
ncbi:hypothetical protein AA0Y32_11950 [Georgenia phoenicis]|uniref:hypothetical protein n=1 Tax=unclassified Georgenia TaxID=2626815 RepID=UPI0039B0E679